MGFAGGIPQPRSDGVMNEQCAEDVRHSRHAVRSWEEKIAQLITAAEAALKASPSADPCNDEPFALQADGYHYWRLRHALEAVIGPLQFDGTTDAIHKSVPAPNDGGEGGGE